MGILLQLGRSRPTAWGDVDLYPSETKEPCQYGRPAISRADGWCADFESQGRDILDEISHHLFRLRVPDGFLPGDAERRRAGVRLGSCGGGPGVTSRTVHRANHRGVHRSCWWPSTSAWGSVARGFRLRPSGWYTFPLASTWAGSRLRPSPNVTSLLDYWEWNCGHCLLGSDGRGGSDAGGRGVRRQRTQTASCA
jgi:hypothetical protein